MSAADSEDIAAKHTLGSAPADVHNHHVHELTIPSTGTSPDNSVARCIYDNAVARPNHVAVRVRRAGQWQPISSSEFAAEVTLVARGLVAAGIEAGDRVALMSRTRYEWTLFDFAVLSVGAVLVPIYETSSAEQIEWILTDSQARAIMIETTEHRDLLQPLLSKLATLSQIWQLEAGGISELNALGAEAAEEIVVSRLDATLPSDLASLIYTSGTTGLPKGCAITHANVLAEVLEVTGSLRELFNPDNSTLLFLPLAHVFGRAIAFGAIARGTALGHAADVTNLVEELQSFRPSFVLAVPRVFEKVHNGARQRAQETGKGAIFDRAERVAIAYSKSLAERGPSLALRLQHRIFDKLVYSKLRAALGGRCATAISGGAPLGQNLGHFFRGVGVTVFEGYGLTETTAGISVNTPGKIKIGSVGRPIPGITARIANDGELLLSGPVVFSHYWNNDQSSAAALTTEGGRRWFHTGDQAEIDNDGFLTITGRKKELIVTANGKNVAPSVLEDRIRAHWLVDQCLVVGDKKPFIAALVTLDPDAWPAWLRKARLPAETTIADQVNAPILLAELQLAVDDANLAVSHAEAIKKFAVLPAEWTEANGQLTPSLKLRRNLVMNESAADIDALYH